MITGKPIGSVKSWRFLEAAIAEERHLHSLVVEGVRLGDGCAPTGRHRAEFWGAGLMVTAGQISRLDAKLDALVAAIDTHSQASSWSFSLARCTSLPSSGTGSSAPTTPAGWCGFEYRNEEGDDVCEMFAVHTPEELQAVIDRVEARAMASR